MSIGKRIKEKRKALGMTQEELAEKVGVTFQAVSKWETEATAPDSGLLNPLSKILDMRLEELMNGTLSEDGETPRPKWGKILGIITKDIHADVGSVIGNVEADIYGNVEGNITGTARNIFGNVEGHVTGEVQGDITGYVGGNLMGTVYGRVRMGVRGKTHGTVIGDGINADEKRRKKANDQNA
jgi:transcriptional regulator with XRE-family HTH domain